MRNQLTRDEPTLTKAWISSSRSTAEERKLRDEGERGALNTEDCQRRRANQDRLATSRQRPDHRSPRRNSRPILPLDGVRIGLQNTAGYLPPLPSVDQPLHAVLRHTQFTALPTADETVLLRCLFGDGGGDRYVAASP